MRNIDDPRHVIENLFIGEIIEVDGSHIVAELDKSLSELARTYEGNTYLVGQFGSIIKVHFAHKILYAYVGRLRMRSEYEAEKGIVVTDASDERVVEADLFGEGTWILDSGEWKLSFGRGVSSYPLPQQYIYLTPQSELKYIFGNNKEDVILLGEHVSSSGTPCYANINELVGKHTAILGSTGSGKSGTVAKIMHSLIDYGKDKEAWNPRIIVLDPHNEYSKAFPAGNLLSTDEGTLKLPYWFLSYTEIVNLVIGKTEFAATSQTNIIKNALLVARKEGAAKIGLDPDKINVDSPIPFLLTRFKEVIEAEKPPQASKQDSHNSILQKLESLERDVRLKFMLEEWTVEADPFIEILTLLISKSQPCIINLSGVPDEVAGITSSVIARTLFNLKVWQTLEERKQDPMLLVCEEAHRYVPNRGEAQYEAAQEAIKRVAKEGRKYGIGLLLVSQRPGELEPTVLSQCNSWLVHRITNDNDRESIKSFFPDSMSGLVKMLSGLRRREVIFVGQAAALPSRILIENLDDDKLPKSNDISFTKGWVNAYLSEESLNQLAKRWRYLVRE
ncbi:hypothetical protein BDE36_2058 [Arcticibacter tournemirensis]|uniref:DUF87 domain-containing protein n=1 Tax=Arcticibacter tournemirensis TaxID=699437 RepID=A0A5M9HEI5_9SPHI|nr:ATP-binding protein [Arcticibacter tournemirensis]KAA8485392.1 DUF87 domain-containing protein [Arcticibacter tournemirensis]TQM50316.1 hypothetical protein BDE36_2058 [Arcticibacter tournemirensis]